MNIKIVYNIRTHKISNQVQTLEALKLAILNLYPKQLDQNLVLYIVVNPEFPPLRVLDEQHFKRVLEIYKQMEWPSLKFLVKDPTASNLTEQDLIILNQSIIIRKDQKLPDLSNIYKDLQQVQNEDQQQQQEDQQQQQQQQQQYQQQQKQQQQQLQQQQQQQQQQQKQQQQQQQQEPITKAILTEIKRANSEISGLDIESQEFQDLINEIIDKQLQFHGLIKSEQDVYKMLLTDVSHSQLNLDINKVFTWFAKIKNDGNCVWKKGEIVVVIQSEPFVSMELQLTENVNPGQITTFYLKSQSPAKEQKDKVIQMKLCRIVNGNKQFFGKSFGFSLTVKKPQGQQQGVQQKHVKGTQKFEEKLKLFMEYTGCLEKNAREFISFVGEELELQYLVDTYMDQK